MVKGDAVSSFCIGVAVGLICILGILATLQDDNVYYVSGYKQGQIDYYNGKIKYRLKVQGDGSILWVNIKQNSYDDKN